MDASKFLPIIGILIFVAVLLNTDLSAISGAILGADYTLLFLAILLHVPIVLLKSYKWKVITHSYKESVPLLTCTYAWVVGFVIGIVTPGRIGEVSKAYYLKDRMPTGKAITTIVIDRIIDIFVLFVLVIAGTSLFICTYSGIMEADFILVITMFFFAFLLCAFLALTRRDLVTRVASPLFRRVIPSRHRPRMSKAFHDFYSGLGEIRRGGHFVVLSAFLSIIAWLVVIFQAKLMSLSLSLEVGYLFLLFLIPVAALLDTLPISFSGLGTRELAMIFFLGIISVPAESAVSFSILIFLLNYLMFIPVGLVMWLLRPIRLKP